MRIHFWFLVFGFWSLVHAVIGQNVEWLKHSEGHSVITEMAPAKDGGYYATGYIFRGMYYGTTQYFSHGADDIFLGKFNSDGEAQWLEIIGSEFGDDRPQDLEVSEKEDLVCVAGNIGPEGQWNRNRLNAEASGILICFDTRGDLAFYELMGKEGRCSSVDLNDQREMIITGRAKGLDTLGAYVIGKDEEFESFLAMMDIDRGFTYAETWKDEEAWTLMGAWQGKDYAVFAQGRGALSLDQRIKVDSTVEEDLLITHFDRNHQVLAQTSISGPARSQLTRVRHLEDGLIFCGYNNQDSSYTLQGKPRQAWGFIGEIADNYQTELRPIGEGYFLPLDVLRTPSSYYMSGKYTFRASFEGITLPTDHSNEAFVIKTDRDFNLQWLKTGTGPLNDYATSLALSDDRLYAGGYYGSDMDFGKLSTKNVGDFTINLWVAAIEEMRTSTENDPDHSGLTLFPNPCSEILHVKGTTTGKIINVLGQVVWCGTTIGGVNTESLPNGSYHFLSTDGQIFPFVKSD